MARPYLLLTSILGLILLWLISQHRPVAATGLLGIFIIIFVGNFLGKLFAKGSYLEMGFSGEYFYMRSAYDIAMKNDYRMYPLLYANAAQQQGYILLNYIEQPVKIRFSDWPEWPEIWQMLNNYPISSSEV